STYSVNLTVTNTGGSNSLKRTNYITVSAPLVAPTAAFTGTPLTGTGPLDVTFTDSSTGTSITNRRWDFGDGNISNYAVSTNPSHRYSSAGTYSVNLTVTNAGGSNSLLRSNYISVTALPVTPTAAFTSNIQTGIAPLTVQFTGESTGTAPLTYAWDFTNDGTMESNLKDPSYTYGVAGIYTVNLTVTNNGGSASEVKTDYITVSPAPLDGKDGIAIFRPSTGYWYFDYNLDGIVDTSFRYGGSGDQIIAGDWDGDEKDGIAIFRPSTGYWYFDYNLDGIVDKSFRYGGSTDQIIKGDWDGEGKDGIAIFRPSTGYWYFDYNLDGIVNSSFRFGGSTDQIIVGKWI
ncbi:MAG TPA: PKD domain-containing protein, partial [Methanoregula sp.]|nr:PKD domain-containing protein [Methanoregula sp.]